MSPTATKTTRVAHIRPKTSSEPDRFPVGSSRLDLLMEGGLLAGDIGLIHGPPFLGKALLARAAVREAIAQGRPAIVVSTRTESPRLRDLIQGPDPEKKQAELLQFVDTVSRGLGPAKATPGHWYVDGPSDLNGLAAAINSAQAKLQGHHPAHLLVIDSISTLIAHSDANQVFRFLQAILGSSRKAGAHVLMLLDDAMHDSKVTESFKHLCDGTIQLRDREGKHQVQILGFNLENHLGWVDYRAHGETFEVVGSFAAGRIR